MNKIGSFVFCSIAEEAIAGIETKKSTHALWRLLPKLFIGITHVEESLKLVTLR